LYKGISEPIYATDSELPQNVMALVMERDEESEKTINNTLICFS
jgi:hypothetical protein